MREARFGLVGGERSRTEVHLWEKSRKRGLQPLAVAIVILLLSSGVAFAFLNYIPGNGEESSPAETELTLTWPLALNYQHKDSIMLCVPDGPFCAPPNGAHAWNDAKGADGIYGTADDCPHCSCYCAPACISMIAAYWGIGGNSVLQDNIYDAGKSTLGETNNNGVIETHGVGMFDGTGGWAKEVQTAYQWSIGVPCREHNSTNPLSQWQLGQYMLFGRPVLWLDRDGWPTNLSASYPSPTYRADMGHAKVIAGWTDNGTPLDQSNWNYLIYDPWPEYNDTSILPKNATTGPGGTFDPYWLPLPDVLNDSNDIFLVDAISPIPEFHHVLLPIAGFVAIALVLIRRRRESSRDG